MAGRLRWSPEALEEGGDPVSLLDDYRFTCLMMYKVPVPDGVGGFVNEWHEGAEISVVFEYNASTEMLIAEKAGTKRSYRVYVPKNVEMDFNDRFKRLEDGQIFRVTNVGTDRYTPKGSNLDLRLLEVERSELS